MTRPRIQIHMCNPSEEAWIAQLVAAQEAERPEHERQMNVEDAATLHIREPEMFEAREGVDPHWPPPELDRFEVIDVLSEDDVSGT